MIDFAAARSADLVSHAVSRLIGAGMAAQREAEGPRDYLGASLLGEECLRKLRYEFEGQPRDDDRQFSPEILRVFERGHDAEARMARHLRAAGFKLLTEKADGGQFGFYAAKDPETGTARIRGHADGIIVGWDGDGFLRDDPDLWMWADSLEFPALWENKGLKNRSFNDLKKKGLQGSKPLYYAQINLYMAYLDIPRALFTAENQDTCEIWADVLTLDMAAAQEASDRGVTVISARSADELPRLAAAEDGWQCKFCPFHGRCWHGRLPLGTGPALGVEPPPATGVGAKAPKPSWMG
jgi:hypothetical protein